MLHTTVSDHEPILLDLLKEDILKRSFRFRFENMWLWKPNFISEVTEAWKAILILHMLPKLFEVSTFMAHWDRLFFHKFREKVKEHKARIGKLVDCNDDSSVKEYLDEKEKLNTLLLQEEVYWKQRAKLFWFQDGDENTKLFHSTASARKKANKISFLTDKDGNKAEDQEGMCEVVKEYFTSLFTGEDISMDNQNLRGHRTVTAAQNSRLTEEFSFDEFTTAIKQIHPDKASGPDGLNPLSFRIFGH